MDKLGKVKLKKLGYSSRDCETYYECICGCKFGDWTIFHQKKNQNGTKDYCPKCKKELII